MEIVFINKKELGCYGTNFKDTKNLSLKELCLFIDRDLFLALKELSGASCYLTSILREGLSQIRVLVRLEDKDLRDSVEKKIEKILWSYNSVQLTIQNFNMLAHSPRFEFNVDFH